MRLVKVEFMAIDINNYLVPAGLGENIRMENVVPPNFVTSFAQDVQQARFVKHFTNAQCARSPIQPSDASLFTSVLEDSRCRAWPPSSPRSWPPAVAPRRRRSARISPSSARPNAGSGTPCRSCSPGCARSWHVSSSPWSGRARSAARWSSTAGSGSAASKLCDLRSGSQKDSAPSYGLRVRDVSQLEADLTAEPVDIAVLVTPAELGAGSGRAPGRPRTRDLNFAPVYFRCPNRSS